MSVSSIPWSLYQKLTVIPWAPEVSMLSETRYVESTSARAEFGDECHCSWLILQLGAELQLLKLLKISDNSVSVDRRLLLVRVSNGRFRFVVDPTPVHLPIVDVCHVVSVRV